MFARPSAVYSQTAYVTNDMQQALAVFRDHYDVTSFYVFANDADVTSHIPESGRGILDPLTAEGAGRLRSFLLRILSE